MTPHPDDAIPAHAPERAVMTEERLAEIERFVNDPQTRWGAPIGDVMNALDELYDEVLDQRAVIAARDAEVKRLTGWLEMIDIADDEYTRYLSAQALAGEAVPDAG